MASFVLAGTTYLPPTMPLDQSEFLELRQQLKESIRKKKNMQNGNILASSPTLEQRTTKLMYNEFGSFFGHSQPVIASRVLKESKSLAAKMLKLIQIEAKNANEVTSNFDKKRKAEQLKDARDYSFLFSDDAKLPVSRMESPSRNIPIPNSKQSSKESHSKPGSHSVDHRRKLLKSDHSGQRVVEKRKVSQEELKRSSQMVPKQSLQRAHQLKKKKKFVEMSEDDDKALRMIRKMFKTDRYAGSDFGDDKNMETNLQDILKEERRSEKLAKKEDAEQQRLIEEEERRERMRKEKKKQKLSH